MCRMATIVGSEPELRLKSNIGGGFLGIVRRAGMGHRGSVLITTQATSGKMGVTYGAGVRTKCGGSSSSEKLWPNLLQDRGEAVAGTSDLGADLGGGPLIVSGRIFSGGAPAFHVRLL